jgi:hypothetical protein
MLLQVTIPHEPFNSAVRDGSVSEKTIRILDETKPEAVYFTERNGHRTVVLIIELTEASDIPSMAEPWFLTFNADVEFHPVMTLDDLQRAELDSLGKKWS